MDFNMAGTFDSFKDGTKEFAEITHEKTNEFHKKYVSKVLPDCGKYGDEAKFIAEMVPGVTEYNAIKDGDWEEFAIAAGLDIASVAISPVTGGAGYVALKAPNVVAKIGTKHAVKEIAEASTKKVVKETAEKATEKIVKETAETGVGKIVKETVEKATKEVGESVDKESREIVEKTVLKVGDKIDTTKFPKYIKEIEKITSRRIPIRQKRLLKNALEENEYVKLGSEARKIASQEFNRTRFDLIKEWEKMTGQNWPRYVKDVINKSGNVIKKAGQPYDVHHIIELSTGGPNKWWNIHPASFPDEHQGGIHAAGSFAKLIFG